MKSHKRLFPSIGIILFGIFILAVFFMWKSSVINFRKKPNGSINTVVVGLPEEHQNTFAKSLKRSAEFYDPFHRAGDLMESVDYDEALEALNESLSKAKSNFHRGMVYMRMQELYRKVGDPEKELWALDMEIKHTREGRGKQELEHRAAEIRAQLAASATQKADPSSGGKNQADQN